MRYAILAVLFIGVMVSIGCKPADPTSATYTSGTPCPTSPQVRAAELKAEEAGYALRQKDLEARLEMERMMAQTRVEVIKACVQRGGTPVLKDGNVECPSASEAFHWQSK